jgi:uncharacterized protein YcbX
MALHMLKTNQLCQDEWFTALTDTSLRLVRIGAGYSRQVPPSNRAVGGRADTSLADGYPYLLTTAASLDAVTKAAQEDITMRRFRPNIVVAETGSKPFAEDYWAQFRVGKTLFWSVKPCARCKIPRLNPDTGDEHPLQHPTAALESLRHFYKKEAYFGVNLVHEEGAEGALVNVGDVVLLEKEFTESCVPSD